MVMAWCAGGVVGVQVVAEGCCWGQQVEVDNVSGLISNQKLLVMHCPELLAGGLYATTSCRLLRRRLVRVDL